MLTLVPPSRLGSPLAFAVIDRKSSTVFLSTFSAVVTLWSTSFPSGSLLSSVLLECENTMKAACTTAFLWAGNQGPAEGVGSWRKTVQGERAGSCHLKSISLCHYPSAQGSLHSYSWLPCCRASRPAPFAPLIPCLSWSSLLMYEDSLDQFRKEQASRNWS